MKKLIKLAGIIAFVAVIGFAFAACDNGGTPKDELDGTTWVESGVTPSEAYTLEFDSPKYTFSIAGYTISSGTYSVSGNTVTLNDYPGVGTLQGTISGNKLTTPGMDFTKQ